MRFKNDCLLKCQLLFCVIFSWNPVSGQIRYSIHEELQLGAFVGNLAADLGLDVKQLSARSLRIVPGPSKQYVDVNLDNGILFVKDKIDREQMCGPGITCVLTLDVVLAKPLNLYQVEVEILDVNDNAPSFPKNQFHLEISELVALEARFPLESAHDPDIGTNSVQTYQLLPNDYFILDVQTRSAEGIFPVLVLQRSLDRETESTHELTLIAEDGGVPVRSGTVQVTIIVKDANDNAPVFYQSVYRVSLLESAPTGTLVITLNATDLDDGHNGEIMYSLSSHSSARAREFFNVDSKTGEIRVKANLDYEDSNIFEINIQAIDNGLNAMPQHCDVLVDIIDVNDNAPEVTLTSLSSTVSEDAPLGTVVALFSAADKDSGENGQVQCRVPNQLPFKLDSSLKNYYRLLIRHLLDRENISRYEVTITCTDAGRPPLTSKKSIRLEVSDINDNAPRFTQPRYTAKVRENNVIGASIFSATAFDADIGQNARLHYFLLETHVQGASIASYVSINSESGVIFAQRSFDYEQLKNFQIQLQVQDAGVPPLASNVSVDVVILDQNDNVPVIVRPLPEYGSTATEKISRLAEPGYLVAKVSATDADAGQNARLSYQIFQATHHNLFTISPDTGDIWTIRRIANKDASKQRLVIVVRDNGTPSLSATVTIILSVEGSDPEIFSNVSGLTEDPEFNSDMSLALLIALAVISTIFLLILIILAVKVHNNRNALGGQQCSLGVCCCFETRDSLHGIQKARRNLHIPPNYVEVFGGDPLSQSFRYESCSTLQSTKRDFITHNTCRSSTGKNDVRNVSIGKENPGIMNSVNCSITGSNEMSKGVDKYLPILGEIAVSAQIRYSIPEELQLGAFVGNLAADLNLDVKQLSARNLRIVLGSRKQYVDVNLDNGNLFVKDKIDRENLCGPSLTCVLTLDAVLENPLNLYQVEVEILDVNDNAPSFPKKQFRLEISELAASGTRFTLESAHDPDIGTNSVQTYQLLQNDFFILDVPMRSGERKLPILVLQKSLDRETESTHSLTLMAKDGGVPVRSGTAQVTIIVKDANDNTPAFPQSVYRVSLLETAPTGTLVITLNATDLDDGPNGEIMYSLSSHSSARARELFDVDSKTGEIRVKGHLNYEESSVFEINIQAKDKGSDAVPEHCDVFVNIIDVNDNAPQVMLRSLSSTVSEDAPLGTVVALFSAADKDSGVNGQVQCEISNTLPFKLDSSLKNYYRLLIQHRLDREHTSRYDVTITCRDAGNPSLTSKKTIRVEVSDINDNAPRFTQHLYTASVMENNVIGASIFSVTAFDPDVGQNARLNYSLTETQVEGASVASYIAINPESGVIFSQRSFDYEQLKNFQIQVQVQDSGVPPLASNVSVDVVILDQNDNVPVIVRPLPEYGSTATETISRFAEPGYLVAKILATDADAGQNSRLSYQIFQATHHNLFTISPDTGDIWTIRRIVSKDTSKQRLVIVVRDNGTPSLSATVTIILSVVGSDTEMSSNVSGLTERTGFKPDKSLSLVIALGIISIIFLVILIILAVKVHKSKNGLGGQHCSLGFCCCFETRNSLNGIQKASTNLQIPPNYVEVYGGDPLSQSFRYESCSTLQSTKRDFMTHNICRSSTDKNYVRNESIRKENSGIMNPVNCSNSVSNEDYGERVEK
uniref:uncharacterized protein n=1 Tax=Pristiophorus japonicus TaxID=55135 RepID=UPI00398E443D